MNLPVINRVIDNTALSTFMRCPREYKLAMLEGWRPKEKHIALSFGAFWHKLLETHYLHGGDISKVLETFNQYKDDFANDGADHRTPERALVEYERYRKHWDMQKDLAETLGFFEKQPIVEMATAIHSDKLYHEYGGKLDRVVKDGSIGLIEDHKTTSRLDKHFFHHFQLSNQMMGYTWMGQKLFPDANIRGVRINVLHILKGSASFLRHVVTFADSVLEEWEANTNWWLVRLARAIESGEFPAHFGDDGCRRMYGKCQFFDVCSSSPSIRQAVLEQNFEVSHWDPLAIDDGV